MYNFRKRLPRWDPNHQTNSFLCLSLRTDLPLVAVKLCAALLTVYEQIETKYEGALNNNTLPPTDVKVLMT